MAGSCVGRAEQQDQQARQAPPIHAWREWLNKGKRRVIRSCGISSQRAKLIFFGIELSGCLDPEAQHICKQMAGVGGEGPEGLKKIYESLSLGFQVNRAIRIEHLMKRGLSVWEWKR
jgi:hypothetical protein